MKVIVVDIKPCRTPYTKGVEIDSVLVEAESLKAALLEHGCEYNLESSISIHECVNNPAPTFDTLYKENDTMGYLHGETTVSFSIAVQDAIQYISLDFKGNFKVHDTIPEVGEEADDWSTSTGVAHNCDSERDYFIVLAAEA